MNEENFPNASFENLILMLATTGLMQLGEAVNPMTQKVEKNLELARHTIDSLAMLKEKTKGNLTSEEEKLLDDIIYELRMKYIEAKK